MALEFTIPRPGNVWRHYKGTSYRILHNAFDDEGHPVVVYSDMGGASVYVQRLNRFMQVVDAPFTTVQGMAKWTEIIKKPRFVKVS